MPPIFDKDAKLKVIEYGDHSKSLDFNKGTFLEMVRNFFRKLFRFA